MPGGEVSTVYVPRPQPITVTAEIAAGIRLPTCVIGHDYRSSPSRPTSRCRARAGSSSACCPKGRSWVPEARSSASTPRRANIKANRRTGEVLRTHRMKLPAAVEYADGKLYVTKTVFGNRRVVVMHP